MTFTPSLPATIPAHFGLVAGVTGISFLVHHVFMTYGVMKARKKYNVGFPDLYATKEMCPKEEDRVSYNSVQRGHQNSLEAEPAFLAMLITAGLKHPKTASGVGCVYLLSRMVYFLGYSSGFNASKAPFAATNAAMFTLAAICGNFGIRTLQATKGTNL